MNRYAQLFSRLDKANQGAFVPFVMLGDPTPELSLAIVDALVEGAPMPSNSAFPSPIRWRTAPPSRVPPCAPLRATPPRTTASACSAASAPSTRSCPLACWSTRTSSMCATSTASTRSASRRGWTPCWWPTCRCRCASPTRRRPTGSASTASLSPPPTATPRRSRPWRSSAPVTPTW